MPQNSDYSLGKDVKKEFDWNRQRPDLSLNVTKTWLKFDQKTVSDNSMAEEVADPNESEVSRRQTKKKMKRIDISPLDCGESSNVRIVNGHDTHIGAYPWIVVIVRFGQPICAGNIIAPYWIVTAAHCFMK